ncbi:MAG: hypothetical protein E6700_09470, partial [Winkia neuii]|uniref:hypothetical protein n=2 Tax=Actinomycetaceae TaxID=2049 RepID=UPI00290294E1
YSTAFEAPRTGFEPNEQIIALTCVAWYFVGIILFLAVFTNQGVALLCPAYPCFSCHLTQAGQAVATHKALYTKQQAAL